MNSRMTTRTEDEDRKRKNMTIGIYCIVLSAAFFCFTGEIGFAICGFAMTISLALYYTETPPLWKAIANYHGKTLYLLLLMYLLIFIAQGCLILFLGDRLSHRMFSIFVIIYISVPLLLALIGIRERLKMEKLLSRKNL